MDEITYTVTNGLYTYFHNGHEYIRDFTPRPFATIHRVDDGRVWVHPTKTRRKYRGKYMPADAQFVGVFEAVEV